MNAVRTWVTIAWAALLASSLVSMMAVFMGSASSDLHALLQVQAVATLIAVVAIARYLWTAHCHSAGANAFAVIWHYLPGWLVFVVLSANSLVMIAELTFILIQSLADQARPWQEHVPALSACLSSVALAGGYASLRMAETPPD
jgi:hypothetical protein